MDGVDTTNPQTGVQGKVVVTDFVEEVQVMSGGFEAEYGGSTGGVINVITKTGTNQFRGSAGGYLNERSWGGQARPILQLNTTGNNFEQFVPRKDNDRNLEPQASLGGPIVRDKLWFWGGVQPQLETTHRTITFVPAQGGQTLTYDQKFRREASYNNSGYSTTNLLPAVTGRGNPNADY